MRSQEHQCALKISPNVRYSTWLLWSTWRPCDHDPAVSKPPISDFSQKEENERRQMLHFSKNSSVLCPVSWRRCCSQTPGRGRAQRIPHLPRNGPRECRLEQLSCAPPIWSWGFRPPTHAPPLLLPPYWSSASFPGHQLSWLHQGPTVLGQSSGAQGPVVGACSLGSRSQTAEEIGWAGAFIVSVMGLVPLVTVRADWGGKQVPKLHRDELNSRRRMYDFLVLLGDHLCHTYSFASFQPWSLYLWWLSTSERL